MIFGIMPPIPIIGFIPPSWGITGIPAIPIIGFYDNIAICIIRSLLTPGAPCMGGIPGRPASGFATLACIGIYKVFI